MTFVPWELTIEGQGSILPEERRITYAPLSVARSPRSSSSTATWSSRGDLLVRLESKELDKQLERAPVPSGS